MLLHHSYLALFLAAGLAAIQGVFASTLYLVDVERKTFGRITPYEVVGASGSIAIVMVAQQESPIDALITPDGKNYYSSANCWCSSQTVCIISCKAATGSALVFSPYYQDTVDLFLLTNWAGFQNYVKVAGLYFNAFSITNGTINQVDTTGKRIPIQRRGWLNLIEDAAEEVFQVAKAGEQAGDSLAAVGGAHAARITTDASNGAFGVKAADLSVADDADNGLSWDSLYSDSSSSGTGTSSGSGSGSAGVRTTSGSLQTATLPIAGLVLGVLLC
ncbi:hypothetical protein HDU98_011464 [Podochytrium sp. JEL0797]|nr:hypothetical protein HDU98_011464 [Podochytrium sp. JEL0797]